MEKAHVASAGPRSTMNPVVLEGPNPRPKNEGGLLGRKISAQMRRTKVAAAMQAATIKTRRFETLPSIEEKPAATAAGWANGCAFAFGAWLLVVEFGPGFGGLVFARRVHRASLL